MIALSSLSMSAQISVTINSVVPETKGRFKGDMITYTISAPHNQVWGVGVSVLLDGELNGGGGAWNPDVASFKVGTYTHWVGFTGNPKERTYQITVLYSPNPDYPDPNDANAYVKSEPYTITR